LRVRGAATTKGTTRETTAEINEIMCIYA